MRRVLVLLGVLGLLATVAAVGPHARADPWRTPATTAAAREQSLTARGVGRVRLGATYASLRRRGLVGRLRSGCELGGPGTRAASLRSPLRGSVDLTRRSPHRVTNIVVTRGAAARGVGIGDRLAGITRAFPGRRVDRSTEEVVGITLVSVPRRAGGPLQFGLDVDTKRVTSIGVPGLAFCE